MNNLYITDIQEEQNWYNEGLPNPNNPFVFYQGYLLSDNGAYMIRVKYKPKYPCTREFSKWVMNKFKYPQ